MPWEGTGQLSRRQAHVLVALLLLEHALPFRHAWLERAGRVSLRRLVCAGQGPRGDTAAPASARAGLVPMFFTVPRDIARATAPGRSS